ncbi:MAG: hypothetical protein H0U98_18435 [Alphaproteobacteria bacterium]|nr:hypothetical protein [Alphaproteobacteria bacterium]
MAKTHWRAIVGGLATAYGIVRGLLDAIGYVDTVLAHVPGEDRTWLGHVSAFLFSPPAWTIFPLVIGGLLLILWDFRRNPKVVHHRSATVQLSGIGMVAEMGAIQEQAQADRSQPDWPLRNLFSHLKPSLLQTKSQADFDAIADEIIDKLSTGQIMAWGRAIGASRTLPLAGIPEGYWLHAKLNIWLLDDDGGNVLQAAPADLSAPDKTQYREILINQAQVLEEWPMPIQKVERDTKLAVALAYAVTGKWDKEALWDTEGEPIVRVGNELKKFEQLACDASLQTWGTRQRNYGPHVKIPHEYWEAHHVNFMDLFREGANTSKIASMAQDIIYFDIMVSRAQFEEAWPR